MQENARKSIKISEADYEIAKQICEEKGITLGSIFSSGIEAIQESGSERSDSDMQRDIRIIKKYVRRMFRELCMYTDADVNDPDFDISPITKADDELYNPQKYTRRLF